MGGNSSSWLAVRGFLALQTCRSAVRIASTNSSLGGVRDRVRLRVRVRRRRCSLCRLLQGSVSERMQEREPWQRLIFHVRIFGGRALHEANLLRCLWRDDLRRGDRLRLRLREEDDDEDDDGDRERLRGIPEKYAARLKFGGPLPHSAVMADEELVALNYAEPSLGSTVCTHMRISARAARPRPGTT